MARGPQPARNEDASEGFTKQELLEIGGISAKTFDSIRKAARVRGPGHGGRNWVFSVSDVVALVKKAESGAFTERGGAPAAAWRAMLGERGVDVPRWG